MVDALATLAAAPILVPPICDYITNFFCPESDSLTNSYYSCLALCIINTANPTAVISPTYISKEIYTVTTEGIRTAYLLWYPTPGEVDEVYNQGRVNLLQTVSQLPTQIFHPPKKWDNRTFASKGDVLVGTIAVVDLDRKYTQKFAYPSTFPHPQQSPLPCQTTWTIYSLAPSTPLAPISFQRRSSVLYTYSHILCPSCWLETSPVYKPVPFSVPSLFPCGKRLIVALLLTGSL